VRKTACFASRNALARPAQHTAITLAAGLLVCILLRLATASAASAGAPSLDWTPVFEGIQYRQLIQGEDEPLRAHALRVDLKHPDIRFFVTPANGDRAKDTDGMKTTTFLKKYGCQVAINASPYAPVGEVEGEPCDVLGLSISEGDAYSAAHGAWGALLITKDNRAQIATPPFDISDVYNAVGGFHLLLKDGANVGTDGEKHPRTAVGISRNGRYLYLLVIDGRQPGYSLGASTRETADLMKTLGACDALNLDGGGSATLVFDGGQGKPKVINRPIHLLPGMERVCANHLGIFAKPLEGK
jgi:hypothetical protein